MHDYPTAALGGSPQLMAAWVMPWEGLGIWKSSATEDKPDDQSRGALPCYPSPHGILKCMKTCPALQLATQASAAGIVALRDSLARWQQEKQILQWLPGELSTEQVAEQISRDEWWIGEEDRKIMATVRIVESDKLIWPEHDPQAAHIHGLMIDRSLAGRGIGKQVLAWAEQAILDSGRSIVRLDCVASNASLCQYYLEHGYTERGVVDFGPDSAWFPVRRFEKRALNQVAGT